MEFKPFPSIKQMRAMKMSITQKIHGCLKADTKITMADGSKKAIVDIINSSQDEYVLGMDESGNLISSRILNRWNNGETSDWISVTVSQNWERYQEPRKVQVTPNHKFFVKNKGYVAASELQPGDKLISIQPTLPLSFLQKQVLIGKMLGDGSFDGKAKSVSFGQKVEHLEYVAHTLQCLGWVAGNMQKNMISGYGTDMCRARSKSLNSISEMFDPWIASGKKMLPENLELSPIALAFWYMDDGNLIHHKTQKDRAGFATNGFTEQDLTILCRELKRYGMEPVVYDSIGLRIRLNKDCADILFTLIAPWIPPVMQYKLPERFRGLENFKIPSVDSQLTPPIKEQEVLEVGKKPLRSKDPNKYDLETETHNYFADGILVHNSNASITIFEVVEQSGFQPLGNSYVNINDKTYFIRAASRTRWIFPGDDNYGFAAWVDANKVALIEKLGMGTHFGEWAGPGINSGEGLKVKTFTLFDYHRYPRDEAGNYDLPENVTVVPVLYFGPIDMTKIDEVMADLKTNGSKLSPGFMRPEGVVVNINGDRYKKVFDPEETQWTGASKAKVEKPGVIDYSYLLQPIRLEKLLSREESYRLNFPSTMPQICKEYVADLIKEGQIVGDEDEVKAITKGASKQIFQFIRQTIGS